MLKVLLELQPCKHSLTTCSPNLFGTTSKAEIPKECFSCWQHSYQQYLFLFQIDIKKALLLPPPTSKLHFSEPSTKNEFYSDQKDALEGNSLIIFQRALPHITDLPHPEVIHSDKLPSRFSCN